MSSLPEQERYPKVLRVLHWAIVALVALQFTFILLLRNLQALTFGTVVLDLHQQCGMVILGLIGLRFAVAVKVRAPRNRGTLPAWQTWLARCAHTLILLVLAEQPLLGLLTSWARGEQLTFLHLIPVPSPITLTNDQGIYLESWHRWLAYALLGLLAVHIGAVLFNRAVRGVAVTERMLAEPDRSAITNRMPLAAQLGLCCGAILAMTLTAGLYGAVKYSQFNTLRADFEEVEVAKFDALRDAQLIAHDLKTAPDPAIAGQVLEALNGAMPTMKPLAGLEDAKAAAGLFAQLAKGNASPDLAVQASAALDNAVMALAMDVFQRRLEISQTAAEGHDMIILALAPTIMISALIAFLLSRSITGALAHARRLIDGVAREDDAPAIAVIGRGEFAGLARGILAMRVAILTRERERHERAAENDRLIVDQLALALSALAGGDLTYRIETPFPGKTEQVRHDFNMTIDELETVIAELRGSAIAIDSDAMAVREAAGELATQTEHQAVSLNETAEAVAGMTRELVASREGVEKTAQAMAAARAVADESGAIMGQTITAMGDVEASSRRIIEMVSLIDQIAFQTNILALNAAIEAARAGDVGRGFAVVAGEVRALASRASEAATQVREYIDASDEHVGKGVGLVQQSDAALQRILANIETVDAMVSGISISAQKQEVDIQRVRQAVDLEDHAVQRNAAMAEEAMAAIEGICHNTGQLAKAVTRFKARALHAVSAIPNLDSEILPLAAMRRA